MLFSAISPNVDNTGNMFSCDLTTTIIKLIQYLCNRIVIDFIMTSQNVYLLILMWYATLLPMQLKGDYSKALLIISSIIGTQLK